MMPLTMAEIGRELEIRRIGGKEETRRFLESLGFVGSLTVEYQKKYSQVA